MGDQWATVAVLPERMHYMELLGRSATYLELEGRLQRRAGCGVQRADLKCPKLCSCLTRQQILTGIPCESSGKARSRSRTGNPYPAQQHDLCAQNAACFRGPLTAICDAQRRLLCGGRASADHSLYSVDHSHAPDVLLFRRRKPCIAKFDLDFCSRQYVTHAALDLLTSPEFQEHSFP